jgi:cysteine desulfurase
MRNALDTAAKVLQVPPSTLMFTSGATESNMLMMSSPFLRRKKGTVIISGIEHPSVYSYEPLLRQQGFRTVILRAPGGTVDLDQLSASLTHDTCFVAVMLVNNVTGAIQPMEKITAIIRSYSRSIGRDIHIHTDAVQALGKVRFSLTSMGADSASFSFHKIRGPKGIGLLYRRKELPTFLTPEGSSDGPAAYRMGTPSPALAAASEAALCNLAEQGSAAVRHAENLKKRLTEFLLNRPRLFSLILQPEIPQSPFITAFSCGSIPAEVTARVLDDNGFSVSVGSACSSRQKKKRERVLTSMGLSSAQASAALRVSTGDETAEEDIDRFCLCLEREVTLLHKTLGKG